MAQITGDIIAHSYLIGRRVVAGDLDEKAGIDFLANLGMNQASAGDYIRCYRALILGKEFKRTINVEAARFYLASILRDEGEEIHENAVKAFRLHINYYDSLGHGRLRSLSALLDQMPRAATVSFEDAVASLNGMSLDELISKANKTGVYCPAIRTQKVISFVRNHFVAAARLRLSGGYCDSCKQPAPFLRSKSGEPYLEVHHKIRLADGGPDTLENTMAMCPNCHRKAHFG